MTDPTRPLPAPGAPRSRVQDAPAGGYVPPPRSPSPYAVGPAGAYPRATPNPYAVPTHPSAAHQQPSNASAIALVVVSALCLFPLALITQIPALILGIMALTAGRDEPMRAARLARAGWWAFAGGLALIAALALVLLAALVGFITAFLGPLAG